MSNKESAKGLSIPKLTLRLFNTESREKELFSPLKGNKVKLYTCGPTVYNFAHIGNFRSYIFEDVLRRTLGYFGFEVEQVMNLTDVDDKTLKGAIAKKCSLNEFTEPFIKAFFDDLATLGIEKVEHYPRATDYIPKMIEFVQKLMTKGIAYQSKDGSVYFSIDKFPAYGKLSHLKREELSHGERIATDEYEKETIGDFVLWKAYDKERDGSIFWESPFGPGRPGWHLECSTMAMALLGETLDIHCGGVDNIFPHHENEIAQSEALTDKLFVRLWMHAEYLLVNNKKMSKSLGNFYTLRDLINKGYTGKEVRYMLLHTHYRSQLNFTFEEMEAARKAVNHLVEFGSKVEKLADESAKQTKACQEILHKACTGFSEALADDLNISLALSFLFDLMHDINGHYDRGMLTAGDAHQVLNLLKEFNKVLALFPFDKKEENIPEEIEEFLKKRNEARKSKNFHLADELRNKILEGGYVIEDTPYGARLKRK